MRKITIGLGMIAFCILGVAAPAHAVPLTITYTLDSSAPSGAGPFDYCSSVSAGPYFYKVSPFSVSVAGSYTLSASAGAFVAVYTQPFNPSAAVANCAMANPNTTLALPANETYWLYLSTGQVNALGTYSLTVNGPGVVTEGIVPTPTTTGLTVTPNPATVGNALSLTATVSGGIPTGSVEFFDGATSVGSSTLSSGVATFSYTALASGTHVITAVYAGDSANLASTSAATTVDINKASTTTSLSATPGSVTVGDPATLVATVVGYAPTGTVEFFDGVTSIGAVAMAGGVATLSYSGPTAGAHNITASYSGDSDNLVSTSAAAPLSITKVTTFSSLSTTPANTTVGSPVTLSASVTGATPTGSVEFFDGATSLGTSPLIGGTATLTVTPTAAGMLSLTAVYSGDSTNDASATASASIVTVASAQPVPTTIAATGTDSIPLAVGGFALLVTGAAVWLTRRRLDSVAEHN